MKQKENIISDGYIMFDTNLLPDAGAFGMFMKMNEHNPDLSKINEGCKGVRMTRAKKKPLFKRTIQFLK